jgi:hypothetical protein
MSSLSLYYLAKSLGECISSANEHRIPSTDVVVCDMTAGPATILSLLSVITSCAMLLYKVLLDALQFAALLQEAAF